MAEFPIKFANRVVSLHSARQAPDFNAPVVRCSSPWGFVRLQFQKANQADAEYYWTQAEHFFLASRALPPEASPVTSYYCALNAAKALLSSRGVSLTNIGHGFGRESERSSSNPDLDSETVKLLGGGACGKLAQALYDPVHNGKCHSLRSVLYNIPYVHRPYTLSFPHDPERFVPLRSTRFVRQDTGKKEAWFEADVDAQYAQGLHLPSEFKRDGRKDGFVIVSKKRFQWTEVGAGGQQDRTQLIEAHRRLRGLLMPIRSNSHRWYFRRHDQHPRHIKRSPLLLTIAALHSLSELARYDPLRLRSHLQAEGGWLLKEFLRLSPSQFVYGIASEITGKEFRRPGAFSLDD